MAGSLANVNVRFGVDMKQFSTSMQNASRKMAKFGKQMKRTGKSMSTYLTAPLTGLGAASVMLFDKQAKAIAQVEAGLRSTGGAVGYTSGELQKMASELQNNSLFGDEDILQNATAQLLTFTNIAGEQFAQTQQVALDLATRLDGDLKSASIMLGKALNDPVANLSALSRAGIQFSDSQTEMIKGMVENNRLADAQNIILQELQKQYGGSAQAAAEAGAGGITQLKNSLGDLLEEFGAIINEALKPTVAWVQKAVGAFQGMNKTTKVIITVVAALAAAIGPLLVGIGLLSTGMATLSTVSLPITATILAITVYVTALAAAAIYLYDNWQVVVDRMGRLFTTLKNGIVNKLADILRSLDGFASAVGINVFGSLAEKVEGFKETLPDEKDSEGFKSFGDSMKSVAKQMFGGFSDVNDELDETIEKGEQAADAAAAMGGTAGRPAAPQIQQLTNRGLADMKQMENTNPLKAVVDQRNIDALEAQIEAMQRQESMLQNLTTIGRGLGNAFMQSFETMINGGQDAFRAVIEYIKNLIVRLLAAAAAAAILSALLGGFGGPIGGLFGGKMGQAFSFQNTFGMLSGLNTDGFANGGRPPMGQASWVGERGPELFVPDQPGTIYNASQSKAMARGRQTVHVTGQLGFNGTQFQTGFDSTKAVKNRWS